MKKLLSKKGITLVEVIVVIAIIAILAAIIVPNFSVTESYQKEARELAKSFYSNVQQVLIEEKFKNTSSDISDNKYTLIYVEVKNSTTDIDDKITIYMAFADGTKVSELPWGQGFKATFGDFDSDFQMINTFDSTDNFYELGNTLKKLLAFNNEDCFYYALVDNKYRVCGTYFSRSADYSVLSGKNFSGDERIGEYIVSSYPYSLSSQWQEIFRDPTQKHSTVRD